MNHATSRQRVRQRAGIGTALLGVALLAQQAASADVVQGTVTPASAKVVIKDGSGKQASELAGGAFQLRLPAGKFTAECTAPTAKTITFFSLAQPTTLNIDCK